MRAEPTIELIAFETDTFYTYNAQPHTVIAAPSPGVIGLGDITLKYNGVAQAINVGEYTVTANVAQGLNYNAANNFVLPVTIIINKAVLAAEHFSFPSMTPLQDEGSTEVPVTLANPYTGAGIITVKYNGNVLPPTEAGRYLLSVSVTEGSNFFATENDIVLDSVLISKTHKVTVRVVNEKMFLMLSPAFTVVATGFILNDSVVTTGGKAVFENVVHGSQIIVNAFAVGYEDVYEVAETTFPAIMQDTTVEIVAIMKTSSIDPLQNGGNNKTMAYISDGVLFVKTSERYNSVSLYNVTGTKVYTSKTWKDCYNLPSLPPGIYIVVFERSGRGIGQKNEMVKVLKAYI